MDVQDMDIDLRTGSFVLKQDVNKQLEESEESKEVYKKQFEEETEYITRKEAKMKGKRENKKETTKALYTAIVDAVTKNEEVKKFLNSKEKEPLSKEASNELSLVIPKIESRIDNLKDPEYVEELKTLLRILNKEFFEKLKPNEETPIYHTTVPSVEEFTPEDEETEKEAYAEYNDTFSHRYETVKEEDDKPVSSRTRTKTKQKEEEEEEPGQSGQGLYEKSEPKMIQSKVKSLDVDTFTEDTLTGTSYGNVTFTKVSLHNGPGKRAFIKAKIDKKDGIYETEFKLGKQVIYAFVTKDLSYLVTDNQRRIYDKFIKDLESFQEEQKPKRKQQHEQEEFAEVVEDLNRDLTMYLQGNKSRILSNQIMKKIQYLEQNDIIDEAEAERLQNLL